MTNINQTNCPNFIDNYTIDINETTFSKENIKKTLSNVGSAIGNGVDFLIKGAKKVYTSVKQDDNHQMRKHEDQDREELGEDFRLQNLEPNAELL